jgi:hypothetical protein
LAVPLVVQADGPVAPRGAGDQVELAGVSAEHEDLEFPTMAAEGLPYQDGGNGGAIMSFTVNGNGGPTGADTAASTRALRMAG